MKIGDVYKDARQYSQARSEYQSGLATCQAALGKHPGSFTLLRDKGKAFFRIAELLRAEKTQGTSEEARTFYRQASEVQEALIARNAQEAIVSPKTLDLSLKSNLAATYTHWGLLEKSTEILALRYRNLSEASRLTRSLPKPSLAIFSG